MHPGAKYVRSFTLRGFVVEEDLVNAYKVSAATPPELSDKVAGKT